jgi:hypothetical protein
MDYVTANVRAFLAATNGRKYTPEELAEILYYPLSLMVEALHSMGLLERREWERRSNVRKDWDGVSTRACDRREKDRRYLP